jgi:hypothetical protein
MYVGSTDETPQRGYSPYLSAKDSISRNGEGFRASGISCRISQVVVLPLVRLSNNDGREFHQSMVLRMARVSVATPKVPIGPPA